jgi:hypothetical protein
MVCRVIASLIIIELAVLDGVRILLKIKEEYLLVVDETRVKSPFLQQRQRSGNYTIVCDVTGGVT